MELAWLCEDWVVTAHQQVERMYLRPGGPQDLVQGALQNRVHLPAMTLHMVPSNHLQQELVEVREKFVRRTEAETAAALLQFEI
jgi:hypothetical protein